MKKSEIEGLIYLLAIAAIVYPFVLLYEAAGPTGLVLAGIVVVVGVVLWNNNAAKKDQKNLDELALYALHHRIEPAEARSINNQLSKADFARYSLIRNLQIMRDSIEISLSSKKRATAESRLQLLKERYQEILSEQSHLISKAVLEEIARVVEQTDKNFHTYLYINVAGGYIEKARKLKTEKSKQKYISLAIETLKEGIKSGRGDIDKLAQSLKRTEQELKNLWPSQA